MHGRSSSSTVLSIVRNHPPVTQKLNFQPKLGHTRSCVSKVQQWSCYCIPNTEKEKSFVRTHQTSCNRRTAPPPPLRSRLQEKKRHSVNPGEAQKCKVTEGLNCYNLHLLHFITVAFLLRLERTAHSEKDHRVHLLFFTQLLLTQLKCNTFECLSQALPGTPPYLNINLWVSVRATVYW